MNEELKIKFSGAAIIANPLAIIGLSHIGVPPELIATGSCLSLYIATLIHAQSKIRLLELSKEGALEAAQETGMLTQAEEVFSQIDSEIKSKRIGYSVGLALGCFLSCIVAFIQQHPEMQQATEAHNSNHIIEESSASSPKTEFHLP